MSQIGRLGDGFALSGNWPGPRSAGAAPPLDAHLAAGPSPVAPPAADRVDLSQPGSPAAGPRAEAAPLSMEEPRLPLSFADRISLSKEKKQVAEAYYQVGRELARRVTGDPESFKYKGVGLSNIDEVVSLWSLQAKHGEVSDTVKSVPVTIAAMAVGALNNVPIEGAKIENGKLVEARASGHNLNPLLNVASTVAACVALTMAPPLASLALAGPLLTAAPLVAQRFGETNAPVHEMAHAMQFMLAGDLLNRGMLDESDLVAVQNDVNETGYLWGGETEDAAHTAETTGDIKPVFEVLKRRVAERLEERYSLGAEPVIQEAHKVLDGHEAWMTRELARRLPHLEKS